MICRKFLSSGSISHTLSSSSSWLARRSVATESQVSTTSASSVTAAPIKKQEIRFFVDKSSNGEYPVYTDFRHQGQQVFTVLRKVQGDKEQLRSMLSELLNGLPVESKEGRVQVKGRHVQRVRDWLKSLGM
eukprot:TRINITY_DN3549_c0_g1_i2.p1 TRINITY_DN3549_c0_g1~~TRINITY_DN3549_c0_g1_i2.p1  ORF type:complete len:131 (+),score=9.65 TRINITY_DN3549_c0_g1_i2:68-460(+)